MVAVRLPATVIVGVDRLAEQEGILRSEAIRRLVELGLASTPWARRGKKATSEASDMAGREIDRASDKSATDEERASRKRRLLKGPKEFRDVRGDLPTPKK